MKDYSFLYLTSVLRIKMNNALKMFSLLLVILLVSHQVAITFGIWLPESLLRFVYGFLFFIVPGLLIYASFRFLYSLFVRIETWGRALELFKASLFTIGVSIWVAITGLTNQCAVQIDEFSKEASINVTFTDIEFSNTYTDYYRITVRGQEINVPISDYGSLYFSFDDVKKFDGMLLMSDKVSGLTVMVRSMENDVNERYFSAVNPLSTESYRTFELYDMSFDVKPSDLVCSLPSVAFNYSEFIKGLTLLGLKGFVSFFELEKVTKYESKNPGFVEVGRGSSNDAIVIKTYVPNDDIDLIIYVELKGELDKKDDFYNVVYSRGSVIEAPIWLKNFETFANKYQKGSCGEINSRGVDENDPGLNTLIEVCKAL